MRKAARNTSALPSQSEKYLYEYITAAGIVADPDGPLFRSAAGKTGRLTHNPLWRQHSHRTIRLRAQAAGIKTPSLRATGITAFMANKGTLGCAQNLAAQTSTRGPSSMIVGMMKSPSMKSRKSPSEERNVRGYRSAGLLYMAHCEIRFDYELSLRLGR